VALDTPETIDDGHLCLLQTSMGLRYSSKQRVATSVAAADPGQLPVPRRPASQDDRGLEAPAAAVNGSEFGQPEIVKGPEVRSVLAAASYAQGPVGAFLDALTARFGLTIEASPGGAPAALAAAGAELVFYGLTSCAGIAASLLLLCCLYDAVSQWRHRARFHACQRKIQHVHEVFLSRKGELPLCPTCVEFVAPHTSPAVVVFLCGHRFHIDCANRWIVDHECRAGCCPICENTSAEVGASSRLPVGDSGCAGGCTGSGESADESKSFILQSLRRQYPDMISEACTERWRDCHTEIWLSELACPRYNSIFAWPRPGTVVCTPLFAAK